MEWVLVFISVLLSIGLIYLVLNLLARITELEDKLNQIAKLSAKPKPVIKTPSAPAGPKKFRWKYYD